MCINVPLFLYALVWHEVDCSSSVTHFKSRHYLTERSSSRLSRFTLREEAHIIEAGWAPELDGTLQ